VSLEFRSTGAGELGSEFASCFWRNTSNELYSRNKTLPLLTFFDYITWK